MKRNFTIEFFILLMLILPIVYLVFVWENLPSQVPMHWNIHNEIDRYGSKWELAGLVGGIPIFLYLLLFFVPIIDPKQAQNPNFNPIFEKIRLGTQVFMALVGVVITHASLSKEIDWVATGLPVGIYLFFAFLGNYMATVKPNYFVGIRVPWTLENEEVWRKTHQLAGKLWFFGALLGAVIHVFLPNEMRIFLLLGIIIILTLIPLGYSYRLWQKIKGNQVQ